MTMDIAQQAEVADLLNDLAVQVEEVAKAQRNPNIPAGTVLSENEIQGAIHRELKQNSMVRMGKVPLPERFEVWDVYGRQSMVPTAQMTRMLSKVNAERPGIRAFHLHRGTMTRAECPICPPAKEPFSGSCQWCFERTGGGVQKRFETENAQQAHFRAFHYEEAMALERQLDREMARAQFAMQQQMSDAMVALARGSVPTVTMPVVVEEKRPSNMVSCPDCGKEVKVTGLLFHKRRWCPMKPVLE